MSCRLHVYMGTRALEEGAAAYYMPVSLCWEAVLLVHSSSISRPSHRIAKTFHPKAAKPPFRHLRRTFDGTWY